MRESKNLYLNFTSRYVSDTDRGGGGRGTKYPDDFIFTKRLENYTPTKKEIVSQN